MVEKFSGIVTQVDLFVGFDAKAGLIKNLPYLEYHYMQKLNNNQIFETLYTDLDLRFEVKVWSRLGQYIFLFLAIAQSAFICFKSHKRVQEVEDTTRYNQNFANEADTLRFGNTNRAKMFLEGKEGDQTMGTVRSIENMLGLMGANHASESSKNFDKLPTQRLSHHHTERSRALAMDPVPERIGSEVSPPHLTESKLGVSKELKSSNESKDRKLSKKQQKKIQKLQKMMGAANYEYLENLYEYDQKLEGQPLPSAPQKKELDLEGLSLADQFNLS